MRLIVAQPRLAGIHLQLIGAVQELNPAADYCRTVRRTGILFDFGYSLLPRSHYQYNHRELPRNHGELLIPLSTLFLKFPRSHSGLCFLVYSIISIFIIIPYPVA